jgi:hypothetical protein
MEIYAAEQPNPFNVEITIEKLKMYNLLDSDILLAEFIHTGCEHCDLKITEIMIYCSVLLHCVF